MHDGHGAWDSRHMRPRQPWTFYCPAPPAIAVIRCWQETLCAATLGIALLLVAIPDADAQSARLTLDPVPRLVIGQYATFTGSLVSASGSPISGVEIDIKDDDAFGPDDYIVTARTGSDGRFAAKVLVKNWDRWSDTVEIYAVYEGVTFPEPRSATQEVRVLSSQGSGGSYSGGSSGGSSSGGSSSGGSYSGGSSSGGYEAPAKVRPQIKLQASSSSVYVGDQVNFYGHLMDGSRPLSGATIHIKEDVPFGRDKILVTTTTDRQGKYSVTWNAKALTFSGDAGVFAVFEGAGNYLRKATPTYQFAVLKYSGSITLDPLPSSVYVGDPVVFSGRLTLDRIDTTNVIVYIMDEDPLNPDDLLATAYVNSDGSYAVTWTARKVDSDREADIYAVFEGGSTHHRYTTCDIGPTPLSGGSCIHTRQLYTFAPRPYVPPAPPSVSYMDLDYVIGFTDLPTVAIAPSPHSYDKVRGYIAPSQEGLIKLSSELASRHGGDWRFYVDVIEPGQWQASNRADIVLNLITRDQDADCDSWGGWAPVNPKTLPIQIDVCTTSSSGMRSHAGVMTTATHEFIHALGVGHTFYKTNDMMCSLENNKHTCPGSYAPEPRPSALNLEAIAALYGRDGYTVPNNPNNLKLPGYFTLEDARTTSVAPAPTATRTHWNENLRVSLEYPSGWTVDDPSDPDDLSTGLMGPETGSEYRPYITIDLVNIGSSIDDYISNVVDWHNKSDTYDITTDPTPATVDGNRAFLMLSVELAPNGAEITWFDEFYVEVGSKIYYIAYMSDPNDYESYLGQFEDVAESIEFL